MTIERTVNLSGMRHPASRVFGRTDWTGFEFTPGMVEAAQRNFKNQDTLWTGLRESGYLKAAIEAGGGEVA